jgi:CheY-like chemotaxis protein
MENSAEMKKKILIIEDDLKCRMLGKDLLEIAGFEVLEATHGSEGIALALKERPDAIVMDLRLPDMRGGEIARELRRNAATGEFPIIYVTASVVGDLLVEAQAIPHTMLIAKPIDTRTFATQITQFIRGGLHG